MPIHNGIKFYKATLVYTSVNDLAPNYMKDMFTYVWDSHSRTQGHLLRMIYTFQLVNIRNCTFKDSPMVVLGYGTLSILTFAINKV